MSIPVASAGVVVAIVVGVVLLALVVVVAIQAPEIRRYLKMRAM